MQQILNVSSGGVVITNQSLWLNLSSSEFKWWGSFYQSLLSCLFRWALPRLNRSRALRWKYEKVRLKHANGPRRLGTHTVNSNVHDIPSDVVVKRGELYYRARKNRDCLQGTASLDAPKASLRHLTGILGDASGSLSFFYEGMYLVFARHCRASVLHTISTLLQEILTIYDSYHKITDHRSMLLTSASCGISLFSIYHRKGLQPL